MNVRPFANFLFGRIWVTVEQIGCTHNHARGAEATLKAVFFFKAYLEWVQFVARGQPFDGGDGGTVGLGGKHGARFNGIAVKVNCTSTAATGITAYVRASEAKNIA